MTDREKIDAVIEYLTEWHLGIFGGHPYDYRLFKGVVFIASICGDDSSTAVEAYPVKKLAKWYDRACNARLPEDEFDLWELLRETEDDADVLPR